MQSSWLVLYLFTSGAHNFHSIDLNLAGFSNVPRIPTARFSRIFEMFYGSAARRTERYFSDLLPTGRFFFTATSLIVEPSLEFKSIEASALPKNESESESELSEEPSESESYLTCDSGVSDDEGPLKPRPPLCVRRRTRAKGIAAYQIASFPTLWKGCIHFGQHLFIIYLFSH